MSNNYPDKKYQQGIEFSVDYIPEPTPYPRPEYESAASIANQKATILQNRLKNYVGSHYMGKQMSLLKPHRHNQPGTFTNFRRPTVGNTPDDTYQNIGPFNLSSESNLAASESEVKYESRFFGKDVDIVIFEPSITKLNDPTEWHALDYKMPEHPEWGKAPETDINILGNDGIGDAPTGPYNHVGSRLILRDWISDGESIKPSVGDDVGGVRSLLSRYQNENLTPLQRVTLDSHMTMCLSVAGGLQGGYAKKANLYPTYSDGTTEPGFAAEIDELIDFHKNKPVNSNTGLQNPTIMSNSWGAGGRPEFRFFAPIDSMTQITHLGVTTTRPQGGWGNNYSFLVDKNIIPIRFKNPTTDQWLWAIPLSGGAFAADAVTSRHSAGIDTDCMGVSRKTDPLVKAWEAGITVLQSGGNQPNVIARPEDPEFNTSFLMDLGSQIFEHILGINGIKEYKPHTVIAEDEFFPFRTFNKNYPRDTVILVAAGQMSDTHTILDHYSARGPGIDIIGDGAGTLTADNYGAEWASSKGEFRSDTTFGIGAPLDPNDSMYDQVAYPFKAGSTSANQTFAYPFKGLAAGWESNIAATGWVPSTTNSTQLYLAERLFTSDGASPQETSWSTPRVIGQTGTTDNTSDNTITRFAYRKNSTTQAGDTSGALYLNTTASRIDHPSKLYYMQGLEDEWVTEPPALTADGDIIYRIERVFTKTTSQDAGHVINSWSTPVIVGRRVGSQDQKRITLYSLNSSTIEFEKGDTVRIDSLGTSSNLQVDWNTYAGTTSLSFEDFEDERLYNFITLGNGTAAQNQERLNIYFNKTDFNPSQNPYMKEGQRYEIVSLGTSTEIDIQAAWNSFFGTTNVTYSPGHVFVAPAGRQKSIHRAGLDLSTIKGAYVVGDTFEFLSHLNSVYAKGTDAFNLPGVTAVPLLSAGNPIVLPSNLTTNMPPNAKISPIGWRYQKGSGTSSACPSVAGRLACMAEEYFHKYKQWPTNTQLRALMLDNAKEVDIQQRLVDWSNTPAASEVENGDSPDQVFYNNTHYFADYNLLTHNTYAGHDRNVERGNTHNFSRREGSLGPSTLGWHPENTPSMIFTMNPSSVATSVSSFVLNSEYTFNEENRRGERLDYVKVVESTLTSVDHTGFKDSGGTVIDFIEGQVLTVSGNRNDYIDTGVYVVVEYAPALDSSNKAVLKLQSNSLKLNKTSLNAQISWSSDIFDSLTFTVSGAKVFSEGNCQHYLKLENESGQSNAAKAYCYFWLNETSSLDFKVFIDSDKPVDVEIDRLSDRPSKTTFPTVAATELNSANLLAYGTITPEKARTSVSIAGQSGDRIFNTLLWEQMERAGFDFDKNGAADALTDGLLYLRYLFELRTDALFKNTVALNSPLSREEILENIRIAEQTFGDVDANGEVDALTDGLLVLRYLFNLTGDALISSAVAENATRTSADEIEKYIESQIPKKENVGTFGYRSFTNSAVANNRPSTNLEVIGEKVTANILDFENSRIEFDANHGIGFRDDFIVKHGEHPTIKNLSKNRFTNVGFIANNPKELLAETPGEYGTPPLITHEGPFNMVEIYKTDSTYPRQYVDSQDVQLSVYNCPVGLELFDSSYFVDAEPSRKTFFENTPKPYTPYSGTSWRWTQETGQFFTSNMGALSTTTFTDVSGTSRTIDDMWWTNGQDSSTESLDGINTVDRSYTPKGIFCFSLRGTNIPNTAQTFGSITVNGVRFKRTEAYYSADSNGNTVWWWHITCRPFADSQFEKLGKSISDWFINSNVSKELHWTAAATGDSGSTYYRLCIKNPVNTVGHTTLVNSAHIIRKSAAEGSQLHTVTPVGPSLKGFIKGYESETDPQTPSAMHYKHLEACGTPPLRADYQSGKITASDTRPIALLKNSAIASKPTSGPIFPSSVNTLSSTNDMSELEAGVGLTKYGFGRSESQASSPIKLSLNTSNIVLEDPLPDVTTSKSVQYTIRLGTSGVISDPVVPNNGSFTLGPLSASFSSPTPLEGVVGFAPNIVYQWQKSANGTTWTDIASDDTTYTNAQTTTLTVTNYSGQSPVGDYYRCKVYGDNIVVETLFTNIVRAKSG